ncbi:MAG: hypothetical protein JWP43_486 [Ramlibacter sp.]|jgi:hypothetical protein|nr:hypothetical protein [Ramlibacter sp.]
MTSFARVNYPTEHPGVVRAERVAQGVRALASRLDGTPAASVLLAAIVAALLVVANQVVDTWTEGHLLAAWIVMWTVVFAALAVFAAPLRRASSEMQAWLKLRAIRRRQAAEDAKLWQVALGDQRVMADLSRAMSSAAVVRSLKTYY